MRASGRVAGRLVLLVAAWALFGFAGAYRWTLIPLAAGSVLLLVVSPPRLRDPHYTLDAALVACLLVTVFQLVPLRPAVRLGLSPASAATDRALLLDAPAAPLSGPLRPVSISPEATGWALLLGVCLLLIFWSARASYERSGGLRMVVRGIAWMGFVLSAVVFIQRAVSPDLIYGFWRPIARIDHPHPIGPFLNRNDLAGWLIMAIPMVFAYALARAETREQPGGSLSTAASMLDSRMLGLAAALLLMCAALLASTSRSGLLGAGCALIALTTIGRRRLSRTSTISMLGAIALLLVGATAYTSVSAVAARFGDLAGSQLGGRATVWRETWPMARDFPWTGIGVGGFERGMSVYQQSTRMMFFNHAHNEYLQVLVEGGVLLALPAGIALVAAWVAVASRLRVDRTPMFWLRAGAASAMLAAAVQSLWDTGLRMPANAVLFAIIAAIALHEPARTSSSTRPHGGPSD